MIQQPSGSNSPTRQRQYSNRLALKTLSPINTSTQPVTRALVLQWLDEVKDPEIPVLSLVDLGVITEVEAGEDFVRVEMTPTFVGCPAIEWMRSEVNTLLVSKGIETVEVEVTFRKPWSSDMISEKGKAALKQFGFAPPPPSKLFTDLEIIDYAECPRCGGKDTELKSAFGPTLCRSIHYCRTCREAFEQFKPL